MKPQIGQSKLSILKHAPTVHRKRRPIELRQKHSTLTRSAETPSSSSAGHADTPGILRRTGPGHPPSLLRRQTTRQRSFMDLDLPSLRALRREPSMMELDPPSTLFAPTPSPSHFTPGPWAFFQAAEAQREQRRAQMEFLTRLQELRVRDEQTFVQLMAGFARECPVQFGQLTGFMKRMEIEMEMSQQQPQQHSFFQPHQQQHQQQRQQVNDVWARMVNSREYNGTKVGLLALAQAYGGQIQSHSGHPHEHFQQQQQHQNAGRGGRGGGRGGRGRGNNHGGRGTGRDSGAGAMNGQQARLPNVPSLRRGKTFQQQQQALQQLTAYQRHLYQQVQQLHQQKQGWQGSGLNSNVTIPMAHELMQYAAMLAGDGNTNAIPPLLTSMPSPTSSIASSPASPISPLGLGSLMAQRQQQQQQQQVYLQQQQQQDPLQLAAMNMQLNMGSSRRSRYKPPPVRTH
ncbi:hypothetical protein BC939DRAFT_435692 [Gamsiella multidivaricata]|uniref:uncharacterized protein n=1 Tax=Gamsiella multidivaricata TaxID=101098 RepID=UPI002221254A|nr:uncharacterized protein BC939DRAFT_435692 [Gamsiella multidivaricata]KAG0358623.1 hypothetical protein BGZ54_010351 [Gamsiella multidivaricata]KAI7832509.1 hypothetical protein BC939DRAFT_435692 [Gamsiella multidivaricata]